MLKFAAFNIMRLLLNNLFKTFIISTVVAIAANCIYYAYAERGQDYDYKHAVAQIAGGTVELTVILLIMTLPVLFLVNRQYWNNKPLRLFLYFSGSAAFLIAVFTQKANTPNTISEMITVFTFIIVHYIFYHKTAKAMN